MNKGRIAAGAAFVLMLAGSAAAQFMRPPQFHGVWSPVVGSGALYEMETKDGQKSEMQVSIVGSEDVGGKTGYWFEMVSQSPRGMQMVMKSLMVVEGDNTRVTRMIMQPDDQQPMEMPMQMMERQGQASQPVDARKEGELVGTESVTTPAGTFTTQHLRMKQPSFDVWVSTKVTPWGMVKMTSPEVKMTLIRVLTGVKSKITGTPRPMAMPPMQRPE